jgi:hypothetical protein
MTASWLAYRIKEPSLLAQRFAELVRQAGVKLEPLPKNLSGAAGRLQVQS